MSRSAKIVLTILIVLWLATMVASTRAQERDPWAGRLVTIWAFCLENENRDGVHAHFSLVEDALKRGDREFYNKIMRDPKIRCADGRLMGMPSIDVRVVRTIRTFAVGADCLHLVELEKRAGQTAYTWLHCGERS